MHIRFFLLFLSGLSLNALAEEPSAVPFAERYDPASITTMERAREVIKAYDKEKRDWDNWSKEESAKCYRDFFVTYCLDKVKDTRKTKINEARRVWLIARDFERKEKNTEAVKERKQREAEQAAKNAKIDAQPPRPQTKAAPKHHDVKPRTPSSGRPADRVLTKEEEKANEAEYLKKQQEHEARLAEQNAKVPEQPSLTPDERVAERDKRRAAAEKKRQENLKKRAAKAAEYERQVKLREEQKEKSVTESMFPKL